MRLLSRNRDAEAIIHRSGRAPYSHDGYAWSVTLLDGKGVWQISDICCLIHTRKLVRAYGLHNVREAEPQEVRVFA